MTIYELKQAIDGLISSYENPQIYFKVDNKLQPIKVLVSMEKPDYSIHADKVVVLSFEIPEGEVLKLSP